MRSAAVCKRRFQACMNIVVGRVEDELALKQLAALYLIENALRGEKDSVRGRLRAIDDVTRHERTSTRSCLGDCSPS
jgi:hypothetical protein